MCEVIASCPGTMKLLYVDDDGKDVYECDTCKNKVKK